MKWSDMEKERDADGNLTPLAKALQSISKNDCHCGDDDLAIGEKCLLCLCEAALKDLWHQLNQADYIIAGFVKKKNEDQ